ncbi:MAG TPA: phosphoglycerate dehydrogenase [Clostridiales bacterium]|nr:phosphoglycerate dehydrogenase [Clostridiales bacterium]HOL91308.1 phosphoglycerate dehydrogenase [Clostridiales bacterium]HPP36643.1 phosphoglycerate dehydrogenase [Clostridiales bacterium]
MRAYGYLALSWVAHYAQRCPVAYQLLKSYGVEVKSTEELTQDELERLLPEADFAIAGLNIWDETLFKKMKKLRLLTKFGSGVDNIDLVAARRFGVDVCNTRGGNANAVAELAVGLMISVLRYIPQSNSEIHQGEWVKRTGSELRGKTLGLVGFGMIARRLAELLRAFNMRIIACDPWPDRGEAERLGVELVTLQQLLQESDIISLHAPYTAETRGMIGANELAGMRDGAVLINCARAGLVDTPALAEALRSGKLAAAALDVFDEEPVSSSNPLIHMPNVICTAHYGGSTFESMYIDSMISAQAIISVLRGEQPENLLNR